MHPFLLLEPPMQSARKHLGEDPAAATEPLVVAEAQEEMELETVAVATVARADKESKMDLPVDTVDTASDLELDLVSVQVLAPEPDLELVLVSAQVLAPEPDLELVLVSAQVLAPEPDLELV